MSAQVSVRRSRRKGRVDSRRTPGSSGSSVVREGALPVSMASWRLRRARDSWAMPRRVAGLLAMVTAMGMVACGGSSNGAASTGSPSPPTTTAPAEQFTSNEYPYRVTLTEDWTTIPAIEKWTPTTELSLFIQSFDRFDDGKGRILHVGAARVPKGTSLQQWRYSIITATPSSCSNSSVSQSTLGGEPALVWMGECSSDGLNTINLAALHGGMGYAFILLSPTQYQQADDRRIFDGARRTFGFTG